MSAPTSKAGDAPKHQRRAAKPQSVPAPEFTAEQLQIARDFAAIDDCTQCYILRTAERLVRNHPRRTRLALRLVSGGGK